jgi:hypothetical protein
VLTTIKRSFTNYRTKIGSMTLGEIFSGSSCSHKSTKSSAKSEYYSDVDVYSDAYIYGNYSGPGKTKSIVSTTSKSSTGSSSSASSSGSSSSDSSKFSSASSTSLNMEEEETTTGAECEYNYDGSILSDFKNLPVVVPVMKALPIPPPAIPEKTYLHNKRLVSKTTKMIRQQAEGSDDDDNADRGVARPAYNTNDNVIFQAKQIKAVRQKQQDKLLL